MWSGSGEPLRSEPVNEIPNKIPIMNRRHVPQSSPAAFKDSLRNHPRQAAAAALTAVARLASGDPSIWSDLDRWLAASGR